MNNIVLIGKSIVYAAYFLVLGYLVFISGDDQRMQHLFAFHNAVNLVPLVQKVEFFTSGDVWGENNLKFFLMEFFGNLALFIPFPLLFMLGENVKNGRKMEGWVFSISLFIEIVQQFTGLGHADIDDLLLNTAGGVLGVWIANRVKQTGFWLRCQSFLALPQVSQPA